MSLIVYFIATGFISAIKVLLQPHGVIGLSTLAVRVSYWFAMKIMKYAAITTPVAIEVHSCAQNLRADLRPG